MLLTDNLPIQMAKKYQAECEAWQALFPNHEFNGKTIVLKMEPLKVPHTSLHPGDTVTGRGIWSGVEYTGRIQGVDETSVVVMDTHLGANTPIYLVPESVTLLRKSPN